MFSAAACSKNAGNQNPPNIQHSFFQNAAEVSAVVKAAINELHLDAELKSIGHISYLRSGSKELAFIFYSSTKGDKSMVVKKDYTASVMDQGVSVTVCQDGTCDCKVKAIFYNDGSVDVGCSCSSCKMVTTNALQPESISGQ